jgi:formylglycine-generating enzyme required for sulfatase activity/tRNA A-37 threonylcarbamoyl transferase component Bud32
VTVAKCPHCGQTIVGQIEGGDGGWTCPSCKKSVAALLEPGNTLGFAPRSTSAGQTMVERQPTPFKPEIVREASGSNTIVERGANGDAKLPPPAMSESKSHASSSDAGGTIAVPKDAPLRTGPGGTDPLIGAIVGGCRILEVLGRGAMGTVYKATQLSLDRTVALKVIREELCLDDDLLQRFQREAKMVGRFSTPHVVQIHDVGRDKRVHFIVMEFVSGGSLLAHVNELPGRRLPPDAAIRYMIEAAEGLREAERLGIVHRDIKPENLLLDHAGRVKVADFGISRSVTMSVELTATQAVIGTPLYMSPEQCRAEKLDHRSDMYSLGATFCHMLAGKRPLHEESVQELLRKKTTMEFLSPRRLAEDGSIPESLSRVIERMTALDRADRYPTFKEVVEDLRRVERGELIEPFQRKAARARIRRRLVKAAVTAVVLAAAGIGGWQGYQWWQQRHPPADPVVEPRVATGFTGAQLDGEAAALRARLRDPTLLTASLVFTAREKVRRAVDGSDSGPAQRLLAVCDDADRLVSYRENVDRLRPASTRPPFDELEDRWKNLRAIADAARPESSGKELRDFVGRDLESREKSDQANATRELASALADVERRVKEGLPAADARRAARADLGDVVSGRSALERIFPAATGAIDAAAPVDRCDRVREELEKLEKAAAAPDVTLTPDQANARLDALKDEFKKSGPTSVMEDDAKTLRARLPEGTDVRKRVGDFLELVTRGNNVMQQLDALRNQQPPVVRPPFDELAAFHEKCCGAVHLEPTDPDWYRAYFEAEPARRLESYKGSARDAFTNLVVEWRKSAGEVAGGGGDPTAFARLHQQLDLSRRNLRTVFGDGAGFTAELLKEEEFAKAKRDADRFGELKMGLAAGLKALDDAARELDAIHSSAEWRGRGEQNVMPKIAAARTAIEAAKATDSRAVEATTQQRLTDVEARATRWSEAVKRIDEALAHVSGDHDLAAARSALEAIGPTPDDPTVKQAKQAVDQLTAGFHALFDELEIGRARSAFGDAQRALAEAAPAATYATDAFARLGELEKVVASGMARVSAGRVLLAKSIRPVGGQTAEVGAFWLDPCAVSNGEFQKFLADLPADRATVERLLPTLAGFERTSADDAMQRLLAVPSSLAARKPDARFPVAQVSYQQAVVYLARQGKTLPTLEEWWLAAKGSLNQLSDHRKFPWSDSSTARLDQALVPDQVWYRKKQPMAVDQGGLAIGFGSAKVHHLSGNVEEWTQVVTNGSHSESRIIGGNFDDEEESRFSGEQPRYSDVTKECEFAPGFRGVVKAREFFGAKGLAPKAY